MGKYAQFFEQCDKVFICNRCKWTCKKDSHSSTSGLRYHLKAQHPELHKQMKELDAVEKKSKADTVVKAEQCLKRFMAKPGETLREPKEPRLQGTRAVTPPITKAFKEWEADGEKTKRIERVIVQMIATSALHISFVEDKGFLNLLSIVAPRFKMKSRRYTTTKLLPDLYAEYFTRVQSELNDASYISFACDSWSSSDNAHSILGLTAHYIDREMHLRFVVVAASPLKHSHTVENLKGVLAKALHQFAISEDKVHLFVRDSASNMVKMTDLLNVKSFDCFAHKMQLAVKVGLALFGSLEGSPDALLPRLTKIVRKLRKSGTDKDVFQKQQRLCSIPQKNLIKGIDVRWNSLYDMMSRFLELRKPLELFLLERPRYPLLDATDWDTMKKIVDVLKPLAVATETVQHRYYSPISVVLPLYKVIVQKQTEEPDVMGPIKELFVKA